MIRQKSFTEVLNIEKQMLSLIHTKGISHNDILELYRKVRSGYEKILLNINQTVEHQEVEYHLWKLHYELIDEFRKRIRPRSYDAAKTKNGSISDKVNSQSDSDKGLEGFKSFLSEASEFYRELILKLRESCGLPTEIFINNKDHNSFSIEPKKLHECQRTCHRLLICLGDLARYSETVKKHDACEWSTAATFYLEAARTWPDSGNPHNQLALLATYVGDAFLALYHCVRSLAVKEPFPDAWRNIMLLFEENRSIKLPSVSSQLQCDFLNPSRRSYLQNTFHEEKISLHKSKLEDLENVCSEKPHLWPILVRTISFLLIRSSLEEFPHTLTTALHSLEALLAVDDTKLTTTLEAYQYMDSSRSGPYRAIQLVSIFIFIVHNLTESPKTEDSNGKIENQKDPGLTPMAFAAIFICMGRLIERCLSEHHQENVCPLLPSVLVFLEWLVGAFDRVETYGADERVANGLSYFFGALADFLNRIDENGKRAAMDYTALWEDHELRGFYPLIRVHETLDFASHLECADNYRCRNESRSSRVFHAGTRIMVLSRSLRKQKGEKELDSSVSSDEVKEPDKQRDKSLPTTEEEEVILFKPITRRNSAPLYISEPTKDAICPEETKTQTELPDEWLRRATSLSTAQNIEDSDPDSFSFCSTTSKDSSAARPPSLSAWVLSKGSSKTETRNGPTFQRLSPIEETASTSFFDLSINDTAHISTIVHDSSPTRANPTPSAPLLPDDASWLRGEADGILGAAPISGYMGRAPAHQPMGFTSALVDGYPMSSSEWLYHYRNSQNMGSNINHVSPVHLNGPALGSLYSNEVSSFDVCDQWGNRWVSNPVHYLGGPQIYQRPFPYVCGVGMEVGPEETPLLQYLKEKERQLQQLQRGPTYMGN